MKRIYLIVAILLSLSASAQRNGVNWPDGYFINGPVSINKGRDSFPDPASFLQIGPTGNSTKGVILPHGNVSDVTNPSNIPGFYFHNNSNNSLYSILGINKLKLLNDNDTIDKVATKNDFLLNSIRTITISKAHDTNMRNDMGVVKYYKGEYWIWHNEFDGSASDLALAGIAQYRINKNLDPASLKYDGVIIPPMNGLGSLNANIIELPGGGLRLFFIGWINNTGGVETLRTAFYRCDLPADAQPTGWTTPVMIYNGDNRISIAADRVFEFGGGDIVFPYDVLISGTGFSNSSFYKGGVLRSKNFGETVYNPYGHYLSDTPYNVNELGMYFKPDQGHVIYYRSNVTGATRKFIFGVADTALATPNGPYHVTSTQNALSTMKYDPRNEFVYWVGMRALGTTTNRLFIDLRPSSDGETWTSNYLIGKTYSPRVLNQPLIFLDPLLPRVVVTYSETGDSAGSYDLKMKIFPLDEIDCYAVPDVVNDMTFMNRYHTPSSPTLYSWASIKVPSPRVSWEKAGFYLGASSSSVSTDGTSWGTRILARSLNQNQDVLFDIENTNSGDVAGTGLKINSNRGDVGSALSVYSKGKFSFSVNSKSFSVAPSTNVENPTKQNWGTWRLNASKGYPEVTVNGKYVQLTTNFTYKLYASSFINDSTYADTSLKNCQISIFDNSVGKYILDTAYRMLASGGFVFKTRKVVSSDYFHVERISVWQDNLVPTVYPLDTLPEAPTAFSIYKLKSTTADDTCIVAQNRTTLATKVIPFTPLGMMDTVALRQLIGTDSIANITYEKNQGTLGGGITNTSGTVIVKLINNKVERRGNGGVLSKARTADTRAEHIFMQQDKSVVSIVGQVGTGATTSTVWGLTGTGGTGGAVIGFCLFWDNRTPSIAKVTYQMVNGTGTVMISNSSSNNAIPQSNKYIITAFSDVLNSTAANKSILYINNGSAIQNNISTGSMTSTGTNQPIALFSTGSTGSIAGADNIINELIIFKGTLTETQRQNLLANQNSRFQIY